MSLDPTDMYMIKLCDYCGLTEDGCTCDYFEDDDEDPYVVGLPTAEDLMSEDYRPTSWLTEAEDHQRDAESGYPH